MKELSLREVQLGELEILKRLDSICREQGLRYFLFCRHADRGHPPQGLHPLG